MGCVDTVQGFSELHAGLVEAFSKLYVKSLRGLRVNWKGTLNIRLKAGGAYCTAVSLGGLV